MRFEYLPQMKPTFIKEDGEILFVDRNGAKWDAGCIDSLFMMAQTFKKFNALAHYYASERIDGKDFYEE